MNASRQLNYQETFLPDKKKKLKPEPKGRKVRYLAMGVTGEMLMAERGIKAVSRRGQLIFISDGDE